MESDNEPYEDTPLGQVTRSVIEAPDDTDRHIRVMNALRASQPPQEPSTADKALEAHRRWEAAQDAQRAEAEEERLRDERQGLVLDDYGVQAAMANVSPVAAMPADDVRFVADAIRQGMTFESAPDYFTADSRHAKYRAMYPREQEV